MNFLDKLLKYFGLARINSRIDTFKVIHVNKEVIQLGIKYSLSKTVLKRKSDENLHSTIARQVARKLADRLVEDGILEVIELPETPYTKEYLYNLWVAK